jgi:hypothetical protein
MHTKQPFFAHIDVLNGRDTMASALCDRLVTEKRTELARDFNLVAGRFFAGLAQMIPQHAVTFGTAANAITMSQPTDESFIVVMQKFQESGAENTTVAELVRAENERLFTTVLPQVAAQTTMATELLPLCVAWQSISEASRRNVWAYLKRMVVATTAYATVSQPLPDAAKAELAANVQRGEAFVKQYILKHGNPPSMQEIAEFMRS